MFLKKKKLAFCFENMRPKVIRAIFFSLTTFTLILLKPPMISYAANTVDNKTKNQLTEIPSNENTAELKEEQISVQAKGMVCSFCAQGIEKKLKAIKGVSNIKVSLETKNIDFKLKPGTQLSDEEIKKILTKSGYDVVKIERTK